MSRKILNYLIPIYVIWLVVHVVLFISLVFSQLNKEQLDLSLFIPLIISHFLIIILGMAFWVWMIVDCAMRKFKEDSQKIVWILLIIFLNVIGAIIYYYIHGKNPKK